MTEFTANGESEQATTGFRVTGIWERSVVSRDGDATTLMLTIATEPAGHPAARLPIDLALVLDRSGSMHGVKLALVKQAALEAVALLGQDDTFSVVMFDHMVQELILPTPGSPRNHERLRVALRDVDAGGGTNLHGGWFAGCEHLAQMMPWENDPHLHRAVLLTDGLANVGVIDPLALTVQANELRQRGITTSTMGVGIGFNEVLLSGMAEAGGGNFAYIGRPHELSEYFRQEIDGLLEVVAPQPRVRIAFPEGMRGYLVNAFPYRRHGREFSIDLRDMTAGDEVTLIFDITTSAGDIDTTLAPRIRVEVPHLPDREAQVSTAIDPLRRVRAREVGGYQPNAAVQVQAARLHADRDHREAMRLDREGRIEEARATFARAHQTLLSAPDTAEIVVEREEARRLHDSAGHLSEATRKDRVHRAMHRSRGGRDSQP